MNDRVGHASVRWRHDASSREWPIEKLTMAGRVGRGLALVGFGVLLSFVGLIWVANLFGVADEHARQIAARPSIRSLARLFGDDLESRAPAKHPAFKLGRYLAGFGFMIAGVLLVVGGVAYVVTGPDAP